MGSPGQSWLCPSHTDYARTLDTYRATQKARVGVVAGGVLLFVALAPRLGWTPVWLAAGVAVMLSLLDVHVRRADRAEWALALSYLGAVALIAGCVVTTGGATSPLLPTFGTPMLLLANRFRGQVTFAGLTLALFVMLAAAALPDPAALAAAPSLAICTASVMIGIIVLTNPHYRAAEGLRTTGAVDPLTGLLNRATLDARFNDAAATSAGRGRPLSVVVFDIDAFKQINDVHGHDAGDRVLTAVAALLAAGARGEDQVYRLGGEEIGLVLPGLGLDEAACAAERLRASVAAEPIHGIPVTVSAGVAAGDSVGARWLDLYRRADHALLHAKRSGRNRVETRGAAPLVEGRA